MQNLTATLIQAELHWENPAENLKMFENLIARINGHTDLIILPEVFNTGFPVDPAKNAETFNGQTLSWLKKTAREKNCVITGSLLINEGENYYNMLIWMLPNGSFKTYAKRHIFHIGQEAESIKAGKTKLICSLSDWNICPLICYDLRFPVWSKNTFSNGKFQYDLLVYVANWPASRAGIWKQLLIARAIENQCYVIGVNRIGKDGIGNAYSGDSLLISPKGEILSDIAANQSTVKTFELPAANLKDFREKFNVGYDWDKFTIDIS